MKVTPKKLPASLRQAVWLFRHGKKYEASCCIHWCKNTINVFNFEVGHNIPSSKGGGLSLDNLYPICSYCNKSMGNRYTITEYNNILKKQKKSKWAKWCDYLSIFSFRKCRTHPIPLDDIETITTDNDLTDNIEEEQKGEIKEKQLPKSILKTTSPQLAKRNKKKQHKRDLSLSEKSNQDKTLEQNDSPDVA